MSPINSQKTSYCAFFGRHLHYDSDMAKRILLLGCEFDSLKTILTVVSALSLSLCVSSLIQYPLYATENLVGGGVELPNIAAFQRI